MKRHTFRYTFIYLFFGGKGYERDRRYMKKYSLQQIMIIIWGYIKPSR